MRADKLAELSCRLRAFQSMFQVLALCAEGGITPSWTPRTVMHATGQSRLLLTPPTAKMPPHKVLLMSEILEHIPDKIRRSEWHEGTSSWTRPGPTGS